MPEVELFTPTGVLAGFTSRAPLSNGGPDLTTDLAIAEARWYPIDGTQPSHRGGTHVQPDDILLVASPGAELTVHMTWYEVVLDVGPYRVHGSLPTHPGFDPARALARPGHTFIALRDATIELLSQPEAATAVRPHVHVNRYAVDRVESSLMLGFFFPGARLAPEGAPVA